jgi:hypothetical protein
MVSRGTRHWLEDVLPSSIFLAIKKQSHLGITMLTEDTIKQIYFYCDIHEENAVIANDVDIKQFARRIIEVVEVEIKKQEHRRCVDLVADMNREVARTLDTLRP